MPIDQQKDLTDYGWPTRT